MFTRRPGERSSSTSVALHREGGKSARQSRYPPQERLTFTPRSRGRRERTKMHYCILIMKPFKPVGERGACAHRGGGLAITPLLPDVPSILRALYKSSSVTVAPACYYCHFLSGTRSHDHSSPSTPTVPMLQWQKKKDPDLIKQFARTLRRRIHFFFVFFPHNEESSSEWR